MTVEVTCSADGMPQRFTLGETELQILSVEDKWYGRAADFYRVRAEDNHLYILSRGLCPGGEEWTLAAFRAGNPESR